MADGTRHHTALDDLSKRVDKIEERQKRIEAQICKFSEVLAEQSQKLAEFMEAFKAQKEAQSVTQAVDATSELNRTHLSILRPSMASSDDPPEVSGCLVFSVEALSFLIFKRPPVKSLCRFRCVCRSWDSLIISPSFVAEHFSFVSSTSKKSYLIFDGFVKDRRIYPLYHPHQNQVTHLDPPFQTRMLKVSDVIRGIICFQSCSDDVVEPALLWNPSTHKYFIIPRSHSGRLVFRQRVGFGFQSSKNDFKVVSVSYHSQDHGPPVCEVLSLHSGLWMPVTSDITGRSYNISSHSFCFLNGTIHWIASFASAQEGGNGTVALLCFDCEHDKLSKMELPHEVTQSRPMRVLRFGGKISLYTWFIWDGSLELWVMYGYGVVSSWNKLFRIGGPVSHRSFVLRGDDGDILVYDESRAPAIETRKRLREKLYVPVVAAVFEESLYSLEPTSQVLRQ